MNLSKGKQKFISLGISHWKTPIDIRGKFDFSEESIVHILNEAKELGIESLFVVTTCNRAQFFAHSSKIDPLVELYQKYSNASRNEFEEYHFLHTEDKAVHQLFELCCGLDSMILGDLQIVSQVKEAVKQAHKKDILDGYTHRLMQLIEDPVDYINAVCKLLPYVAGKVKPIENEQRGHRDITINLVPYED